MWDRPTGSACLEMFRWFSALWEKWSKRFEMTPLYVGLICTELLGSLSSLIASYRSFRPPDTESCSSAKWPHSWPSWRTTSAIVTSSIYVWMVRSRLWTFDPSLLTKEAQLKFDRHLGFDVIVFFSWSYLQVHVDQKLIQTNWSWSAALQI